MIQKKCISINRDLCFVTVVDIRNHHFHHIAKRLTPPTFVSAPKPELPAMVTNLAKLLDKDEGMYHNIEFLVRGELVNTDKGLLAT